MLAFVSENLAPIMFASLVVVLLIGYPVAFSLAAVGIFYGIVGIYLGMLDATMAMALPLRIWNVMGNDTLLAIPFFTFMGLILERSGMAEDLLDTIGQLFGEMRGGLAFAVIFVGTLLAATTGVVAASVISMGLISLPIMLRYGYDRRYATGIISASGTLAQIVPPSLVLIVMADQLGRSVGDMYKGAFLPSLALVGLYVLFAVSIAIFKPQWSPALPPEAITLRKPGERFGRIYLLAIITISVLIGLEIMRYTLPAQMPTDEFLVLIITLTTIISLVFTILCRLLVPKLLPSLTVKTIYVLVPPLLLIFLVLGTIFLGIATPTEGGAMGAVGALAMTIWNKRLTFKLLKQAIIKTGRLSTFVMFIVLCARIFSLTFYSINGHVWVQGLLTNLPGGEVGFLLFANILIFLLAFFLDFFELAFIVIPLLAPAAEAIGIDLVWFGVLLAVNLQASFLHPPFGFSLFFMRSVSPKSDYIDHVTHKPIAKVTLGQIYWGAIPFIVAQAIMIVILISYPRLVMVYADDYVNVPADTSNISIGAPPSYSF